MCISASVAMNLWLCFFVLFVVGSTSAKSITYYNVTLSSNYTISAEDLLKNVSKAVVEFDKNLDKYIDWVSFDNMFEEMLEPSGQYSVGSIGDVREYFLRSRDFYFQAVNSVYGWCGEIDVLMTAYMGLFDAYEEGVEDAQKEIIINSLDSGLTKMEESVGYLAKSQENLNTGIEGLYNVMSNISKAFRHDQSEHDSNLDQLDRSAMNSSEKSVIGGIINHIMVETKYKPDARQNFEKFESSFDFMKSKISKSIKETLKIKDLLYAEALNVGGLQGAAIANRVIMGLKSTPITVIENAATSLKNKCRSYQVKHGLKV